MLLSREAKAKRFGFLPDCVTEPTQVLGHRYHSMLHDAAYARNCDIVQNMINKNIDVNFPYSDHRSHLLLACQQTDNSDVIKLLIHAKADVSDEEILVSAIAHYKQDIIDLILEQKVSILSFSCFTNIYEKVDNKGHVDFSKHFLPKRIPRCYGYKPIPTSGTNFLSTAICYNNVDAVRSLLYYGASLQDLFGRDALEVVVSRSSTDKRIKTLILSRWLCQLSKDHKHHPLYTKDAFRVFVKYILSSH